MDICGFKWAGVLCELTNPDGTMTRLPEIKAIAERHAMPILTIGDLVLYKQRLLAQTG
jgi:3,4-dihydroxy 2-butanone 4-phosphate synthase